MRRELTITISLDAYNDLIETVLNAAVERAALVELVRAWEEGGDNRLFEAFFQAKTALHLQ